MLWLPRIILLTFLIPLTLSEEGHIIVPPDNCKVMQRAFENIVHSSDRCLIVTMDHIDCPLMVPNASIFSVSLTEMFTGLVLKHQHQTASCHTVLAFFEDFNTFGLFIRNKNWQAVFKPFTRIFVFTLNNEGFEGILDRETHKHGILYNGLFMSFVRILNETHYEVEDVLTNERHSYININELEAPVPGRATYQLHPLFTTKNKEFNVSLFHCPPHVIKLDQRLTMDSYDGSEFRFLRDITVGWKVNLFDRHFLFDKGDTWDQVARDVEERRATMGMCSMWMVEDKYKRMDLSKHFSFLCGTFLVPKPMPITQASYIYLPLSSTLWGSMLATLFATAIIYYCMYRSVDPNPRKKIVERLSRAFLDIINIATCHGLPKIIQRVPIRLLIMSWTLLSLLLGTAYSTKYTSILTQPMYTKAVDTIEDFLDSGLRWGEVGDRSSWKEQYLTSGNPYFMQLPSKMDKEEDLEERCRLIPTGRYARYVKILGNNYVTDTETFSSMAHHLRLMKTCIDRVFTVFPFSKNSPYTSYVNRKLGQYTDAGIIEHWFNLMRIKYGKAYMAGLFDKNNLRQKSDSKSLEFQNVIGAFYLLGTGLVISFVAFILELHVHNRKMRLHSAE